MLLISAIKTDTQYKYSKYNEYKQIVMRPIKFFYLS